MAAQVPERSADDAVSRLVASLLGETPMIEDLRQLTDEIGGRPTGSAANEASVDWAMARLIDAGVSARRESFEMPMRWSERSSSAEIVASRNGERTAVFAPRIVAMPFSAGTGGTEDRVGELVAPLVDGGAGSDEDFVRLGDTARGAFVLIETDPLLTIDDLFAEYLQAASLEPRAFAAGAAGVVYMGSRERDVLYRHNAALGTANEHPMLIMERSGAERAARLLRQGQDLELRATVDIERGAAYSVDNVIGEIVGAAAPEEVVVVGAHLDSWGLGTGALDNGCNVAMLIDIARQMERLGLRPRRTVRFALWNGEEQGLHGSWGYVRRHREALDRHVVAMSFDIGSGRIEGFFTGGRPEVAAAVDRALEPVAGLGPFTQLDVPIVGTDNYDFMMEGVPNLVASQASANYGPNYHAGSDTFEQVDLEQLRLNAAIAAAVVWSFADAPDLFGPGDPTPRQSAAAVRALVDSTDLADQMRSFGVYDAWVAGERGLGSGDLTKPGDDSMNPPNDTASDDTPDDTPDDSQSNSAGSAQSAAALGTAFELEPGETVRVDDPEAGPHSVRLVGVVDDSRCPTGTNCLWAGEVTVHVEVGPSGSRAEDRTPRSVKLTSGATGSRGGKPSAVAIGDGDPPRALRLLEVTPYPAAGKPIAAKNYRARFELVAAEVDETPSGSAPLR